MTPEPAAEKILSAILEDNKSKIGRIGEKHEKIRQVKAVAGNTKPNPDKLFVAEGIWSHEKILELHIPVRSFIFCPNLIFTAQTARIAERFMELTDDVYAVSDKTFMKISERDRADGLLSVCEFPVCSLSGLPLYKNSLVVVLDGCEIPGNVGTIARTCDGAKVDAIFLVNRRVRLTHPKVVKGSMGGALAVPFFEFDTVAGCAEWLKARNFSIYIADTAAEKFYYECEYAGRSALVMGSERYGADGGWYVGGAQTLSIPMLGVCDSLNVGVAASIILYDMSVKLGKTRAD